MLLWNTLFYAPVRIDQETTKNDESISHAPYWWYCLSNTGLLTKSTALCAFNRAWSTFGFLGCLDSTGVLGFLGLESLVPFDALGSFC